VVNTADRGANRALHARFDEIYDRYRRLRSGMDDLQRELANLRVSARSSDGLIEATVGPRGQLVDLKFDARAYREYQPAALAAKIVAVTASATAKAADEVRRTLSAYLPEDSGAVRFLETNDFGDLLARQDALLLPPDSQNSHSGSGGSGTDGSGASGFGSGGAGLRRSGAGRE
jgi:DNA-binding protein YbaB